MKRTITLLIVLFVAASSKLTAQQDAQFSQYMFNSLFYNPAVAGTDGFTNFTLIHRTQWTGFSTSFDGSGGNPTTQTLSASTPVDKLRGGVGFHIVNDNLGPQSNLEAQVSYAYYHQLSTGRLSIGVRAGIFGQSLDFDQYRWVQDGDPILDPPGGRRSGKESQVRPDLGLGVFYRSQKYYVGLSANHLIKSEFDFGNADQRSALEKNLTLTAGYDYQLNFNLTITPTLLVKSDFNSYSFDIGAIGTYNDKMWGGISFRQSDAAIIILGYSLLKDNSLKLGYSFDYIIQGQDAKQPTSHEFLLTYSMPVIKEPRKVIRTPRFRH